MKSIAATSVAVLLATFAIGCSGEAPGETDASEGAVVVAPAPTAAAADSVKAFLENKPVVGQVGGLHVDATTVAVVIPNDLATGEKISNALPHDLAFFANYGDSGTVRGGVTPNLNDGGLLSLLYSIEADGFPHPSLLTYTFDLQTGARLELKDLLTPAGVKAVVSACEATIKADPQGEGLEEYCASSANAAEGGDGARIPASFELEKTGIRFLPTSMPSAAFMFVEKGVLVPWAKLAGNISHAGLKALAERSSTSR